MKTAIITIIVIVGLVGILAWFGSRTGGNPGPENTEAGPGVLAASENSFDFGAVSMAKGLVTHEFRIRNDSANPVTVTKMYTSCMCTEAGLEIGGQKFGPFGMPGHGIAPRINKELMPGGEGIIEVTFDPAAHGPAGVGPVERAVIVENDSGSPLELIIKASVTP